MCWQRTIIHAGQNNARKEVRGAAAFRQVVTAKEPSSRVNQAHVGPRDAMVTLIEYAG